MGLRSPALLYAPWLLNRSLNLNIKELEKKRDFIEDRIRKQNAESKGQGGSPIQTKRLERINKQINLKLKKH